ncbi:hypothetical protein HR12_04490, partial [Microbacterium sp. SUBG005]
MEAFREWTTACGRSSDDCARGRTAPGPDISDDPAAYARLLVLEDLERAERAEPVAPAPAP